MLYTGDQCENPRCARPNLPAEHLVTDDEHHFCDWFCHYEWEIAHGRCSSNRAFEAKFCNSQDREKELIGEINDDIHAYSTRYKNLLFVIYDAAGYIRDEEKFKQDIESIEIVKH